MANQANNSNDRVARLADGHEIPRLGLGVWQVPDGPECVQAVKWALESGYRHVDTAQAYGNEASVGQAIRESGVAREEIFIATKFHPDRKDPVAEAEGSLERLGVDFVDLYIVHWPGGGPTWAWPGMEKAHERGLARSIGVSNFGVDELEQVLSIATVPPVVDQVNASPFSYRRALFETARKHELTVEAYSPLGTGRHLNDGKVRQIAERNDRSPAQVLLRWCVQRDLVVIPKSTHQERIAENSRIFDFTLSETDMDELDALDGTRGTARALDRKWW